MRRRGPDHQRIDVGCLAQKRLVCAVARIAHRLWSPCPVHDWRERFAMRIGALQRAVIFLVVFTIAPRAGRRAESDSGVSHLPSLGITRSTACLCLANRLVEFFPGGLAE